ncbi:MAG: M64 family metallopeptidase, partial [Nanoarchaeota archaeon]|nr:M64 family metallopeptidase [Nanoarchaeota archaeon]
TVYNEEDIKTIFGIVPFANDGEISINYVEDGKEKEFGILYGAIVTDVKNKLLVIKEGKFRTSSTRRNKVEIKGNFIINASDFKNFIFNLQDASYSNFIYSFICKEDCEMDVSLYPETSSANLKGRATLVYYKYLNQYENGKSIGERYIANISDFSDIRMDNSFNTGMEILFGTNKGIWDESSLYSMFVFSAKAENFASFDDLIIESDEEFYLIRFTLFNSQTGEFDFYYAVKGTSGKIWPQNEAVGYLVLSTNKDSNDPGFVINNKGHDLFEVNRGSLFLLPNEDAFGDCASFESRNLRYIDRSCLFMDSYSGLLNFKLRKTPVLIENSKEIYPTNIKLIYHPSAQIRKLYLEQFALGDKESSLLIGADWTSKITFDSRKVTVKEGNWYDLGVGFSTYIYDNETDTFNQFECRIDTKECFLEGIKVYSFKEQKPIKCESDDDCGEDAYCKKNNCIKKTNCKEFKEISSATNPSRPLDILFIADGYSSEEDFLEDVQFYMDKESKNKGILSISPFKENSGKFIVWTIYTPTARIFSQPNAYHMRVFQNEAKQCAQSDVVIVLTTFDARIAQSNGLGGPIFMSSYFKGRYGDARTIVHEFGHAFGGLADEYCHPCDKKGLTNGFPHPPNCLTSYNEAKTLWGQAVADKAKTDYRSCGGSQCDERCKAYYRPSENSIMKGEQEAFYFNKPSLDELNRRLIQFG